MPNVLIRDLPPEVHARLVEKAKHAGTSLQQDLVRSLTEVAEQVTLEEILTRIESRSGGRGGFAEAVQALDEARSERP